MWIKRGHWVFYSKHDKLFLVNTQLQFSSVAQSCLSLQPHGLQHDRPPRPSPAPRVYPNSCPLSRWCYPTISASIVPFSFHLQPFPASGSFPMSRLFTSGGQSIGVLASTSLLPMNTQDWSPLRQIGWILLQSKWLSRVFSNTKLFKSSNSLVFSFLYSPTLMSIHDYWKNHNLARQTFVGKVMSLLLICCWVWS